MATDILKNEEGVIIKVDGFKIGSHVNFHELIGGPITSRGHKILEFEMFNEKHSLFRARITKRSDIVNLDNLSLDRSYHEPKHLPAIINDEFVKDLSSNNPDIVRTIETFLSSPEDQAFQSALYVYKNISAMFGALMAEAIAERMKRNARAKGK